MTAREITSERELPNAVDRPHLIDLAHGRRERQLSLRLRRHRRELQAARARRIHQRLALGGRQRIGSGDVRL